MISKELSNLMGKESEHAAVFGSIWRWEWLKRLPMKEAKKFLDGTDCPLCSRCPKSRCLSEERTCPLYVFWGYGCTKDDSLYKKAKKALNAGNEKDWSRYSAQLCNALWQCWNKLFEEPKEERTYDIGDKFTRKGSERDGNINKPMIVHVGCNKVCLIDRDTGRRAEDAKEVGNIHKITEKELGSLYEKDFGEITLIEGKD